MAQRSHEYYNFIVEMYDDMYKDEYWQSVMAQIEAEISSMYRIWWGNRYSIWVLELGNGHFGPLNAVPKLRSNLQKDARDTGEKLLDFQDVCKFINCKAEKSTKKVQDKFDVIFLLGDVLSYVEDIGKTLENVSKIAKKGTFAFGTVDNFGFYMKEAVVYGSRQEVRNLQKTGRLLIGSEYGAFMSRGISDEELIESATHYGWRVVDITALGIFKSLHLNEKYGKVFYERSRTSSLRVAKKSRKNV